MAKWPNHFISGKQFQKGQMATLNERASDQPVSNAKLLQKNMKIGRI
jgi:hypothetical protein